MRPKFIPRPGQTDYTNVKRAPVINCIVKYEDKILLLKRSTDLNFYPNYWNGISGFLDDDKSVIEKAKEELSEEVGFKEKDIISIKEGKVFEQEESRHDKVWIVHPVLVEVNSENVKTDWESQEYKWGSLEEVRKMDLLPGFESVLDSFKF